MFEKDQFQIIQKNPLKDNLSFEEERDLLIERIDLQRAAMKEANRKHFVMIRSAYDSLYVYARHAFNQSRITQKQFEEMKDILNNASIQPPHAAIYFYNSFRINAFNRMMLLKQTADEANYDAISLLYEDLVRSIKIPLISINSSGSFDRVAADVEFQLAGIQATNQHLTTIYKREMFYGIPMEQH